MKETIERIENLLAEGNIGSAGIVLMNSADELTSSEFNEINRKIKNISHTVSVNKRDCMEFPSHCRNASKHMSGGHGHR